MIDLHSHVLPGIDDGPADLAGSLAIARRAVECGTGTLLATPHASADHPNDAATVARALAPLRAALEQEGIPLRILPGAEIAITYVAEMDPDELAPLALGGGEWLLIEPPFSPVATGLDTGVRRLLKAGHRVVLAHPERCPAFQRRPTLVAALVAEGVLTSLTAGSLTGRFGSTARRFALALLEAELAHNVASDAHDAVKRPPSIAAELNEARLDPLAQWLTEDVPGAILYGGDIPPRPAAASPRRQGLLRRLLS